MDEEELLRILGKRKGLYKKAIEKWGNFQITIAIEEMAELITALCKLDRKINGVSIDVVSDEMADVEIMLEQLKTLFKNEKMVTQLKAVKLRRLETRLSD